MSVSKFIIVHTFRMTIHHFIKLPLHHGNFSLGMAVQSNIAYRPLLRRPKFNAGPINAGLNNAGSKKQEIKEGLFFHF